MPYTQFMKNPTFPSEVACFHIMDFTDIYELGRYGISWTSLLITVFETVIYRFDTKLLKLAFVTFVNLLLAHNGKLSLLEGYYRLLGITDITVL